jgi:hypothetical protein
MTEKRINIKLNKRQKAVVDKMIDIDPMIETATEAVENALNFWHYHLIKSERAKYTPTQRFLIEYYNAANWVGVLSHFRNDSRERIHDRLSVVFKHFRRIPDDSALPQTILEECEMYFK